MLTFYIYTKLLLAFYITAANHGPPLYGHIRCRIVAQPNSVAMPLSDGILTIKPVGYDYLYQNMRCRLQVCIRRT